MTTKRVMVIWPNHSRLSSRNFGTGCTCSLPVLLQTLDLVLMNERDKQFNRSAVCLELREAMIALERCHEKAGSGKYDDDGPMVIAIEFQQVLTHLCLAWHFKRMTDEEIKALSQEEFDLLANTVPNFGFELKLMDGIDAEE